MAKRWRELLERADEEHKKRLDWEETHPPITRITVEAADAQRRIEPVGEKAVTCSLPCYGNYIPARYSHFEGMINVFDWGIRVPGWEAPSEGQPAYMGTTCWLAGGKICVATDETLRRSVEK